MEDTNNKKKAGRPTFKPTDDKRLLVKELSGVGIKQEQIASILKISDDTLRKYFKEELELGIADAHANMARAIYKKAINGSEKLMMYYGNCQMGWSEKSKVEITGANGGPLNIDINVSSQEAIDRLLAGMKKDEE